MEKNNTALSPVSELLANIPTANLTAFQESVYNRPLSRLGKRSHAAGKSDTALHIGTQLLSEDIVGHPLTIIRVGFASIPQTDENGNPVYKQANGKILTDENGDPVQETSVYPICHFSELPGYWYNGGMMLKDNILEWAEEMGDDTDDFSLPLVNEELRESGGIPVFFMMKVSKAGRKYVNMVVG